MAHDVFDLPHIVAMFMTLICTEWHKMSVFNREDQKSCDELLCVYFLFLFLLIGPNGSSSFGAPLNQLFSFLLQVKSTE